MLADFYKEGFSLIPKRLLASFKDLKISSEAFILLLYLIDQEGDNETDTSLIRISETMGWSENLLHDYLAELVQRKYIEFVVTRDSAGKQSDRVSTQPLFDFLEAAYQPKQDKSLPKDLSPIELESFELIPTFEGEFGRPLTQMELMEIIGWKDRDKFSDEIILLALKQAVMNQALSFKYIDRILIAWKKKNIRTLQEAQADVDSFNRSKVDRLNKSPNNIPEDFTPINIPHVDWSFLQQ